MKQLTGRMHHTCRGADGDGPTYSTTVANYWQAWSIARPLCEGRATCTTHRVQTYSPGDIPRRLSPRKKCQLALIRSNHEPVFENYVFYVFFSKFKKNAFFTCFWNDVKKRRKRYQSFRMITTLAYILCSETTDKLHIHTTLCKIFD